MSAEIIRDEFPLGDQVINLPVKANSPFRVQDQLPEMMVNKVKMSPYPHITYEICKFLMGPCQILHINLGVD